MKLLSRTDEHLLFELSEVEDVFIRLTLSAYPIAKEGWPQGSPVTKEAKPAPDASLLEDALKETKEEHRRRLESFFQKQPMPEGDKAVRLLRIPAEDVEWLLQVANEIRVGSWYALGCPTEREERKLEDNPDSAPHLIRFDFSGWLLTVLLDAVDPG